MYSGIKERINIYKKLEQEEKEELKEMCKQHHAVILKFIEVDNINIPHAVRNALEDRLIELSNIILKS